MVDQHSKTKTSHRWALAVVAVAIVAIYFWIGSTRDESRPQLAPQAETVSTTENDESPVDGLPSVNKAQAERPAELNEKPAEQQQLSTPGWAITTPESVSMPLPKGVVIYEPVSVDMDSPLYPEPGVQVSLHLPGDDETRTATVKSSNENPNGDYSWRGYLDGHGTDYPVVMTYGANSVFATVTTPKGSYTLESINGSGWIYKNPAEIELSEPGKNDYLEVPHDHNHD